MDSRGIEIDEDEPLAGTPEDVAALYAWAGLKGARYRDFSGSRREHRAKMRYRAALLLRDRELAAGNAEAAAQASAVALREEREIAEARASAERQARDYLDSAEAGPRSGGSGAAIPKDAASSMRQSEGESGDSGEPDRMSLRAPSFGAYDWAEGMEESWEAAYLASDLSREVAQLPLPPVDESGLSAAVSLHAGMVPQRSSESGGSNNTAEQSTAPAWLRGGLAVATDEPGDAGRNEP